jgi:ubiquitin-conjugating enzyme E2 S
LQSALPPNYLFPGAEDGSSHSDDLTQLAVLVTGADGTPYSAGVWRLHLRIPTDYPKSPPKATFKTRIYHPNVDEKTGAVCLETLKRDWDPKLTLKDILVTISCLLIQPNPDSALNAAAGSLIQEDYEAFSRQARLMTSIHAPIPKSLSAAIQEAKQRGEEVVALDGEKQSEGQEPPEEDDTKENDPRQSSNLLRCVHPSQATGKRPLSELPVPEDRDAIDPTDLEPQRKSPRTMGVDGPHPRSRSGASTSEDGVEKASTHDHERQVNLTTDKQRQRPGSAVGQGSSTSVARRKQPRMGIRRL